MPRYGWGMANRNNPLKPRLTARQARFVEEFLVDLNATQAAIRAGYSPKTAGEMGCENLKKPQVMAAITKGQTRIAERTGVTQDMVVAGLLTEARRTGEGSSHAARVSAWGLLGKHLGMLEERHRHIWDSDADELSNAELAAIARGSGQGAAQAANGSDELPRVH